MNINAINEVKAYIKQGKWHSYLVIFPTSDLVQKFTDLLFDNEITGIFYPRIFTFESFIREILSKQSTTNVINEIYKLELLKKIISHLQMTAQLKYIKNPVRYGILNYVNEIIVELKQAAITPSRFTQAVKACNLPKLDDLALIYEKYVQELEKKGLKDREDRFLEALHLLKTGNSFLDEVEYIYMAGFMDNTPVQEQIFVQLKNHISNVEIDLVSEVPLYPGQVVIYNERGYAGEVVRVLHEVIRLLESGVPPQDIAMVARNPQAYASLLTEHFAKVNIALDIDIEKPLIDNPLIKSLMMWFNITVQPERSWALDLLLSNHYLVNVKYIPTQVLNWCREKGRHTMEEWLILWQNEAEDLGLMLGEAYQEVNNIIGKISELYFSTVREGLACDIIDSIIYNLDTLEIALKIKSFSIDTSLERRISLAYREKQALEAFIDVLDNIYLAERNNTSPTTMVSILKTVSNYLNDSIYIDKQGNYQGISVLAPTEVRNLDFHSVLVLGMEQAQFPKIIASNPLLRDSERLLLRQQVTLPLTAEIYEREKMLFNLILQAGREEVIFTYPGTDEEGQPNLASLFIGDILEIFPEAEMVVPYLPARNLIVEEPLITHLLRVESERSSNIFSSYEGCFSAEKLINMVAEQTDDKVFSISTLNDYAKCPLKYFFVHELGLRDEIIAEAGLSKLDLGALKHEILALVLADYSNLTPGNLMELVRNTLEIVCSKRGYGGQDYPDTWLWELEKKNIIESLTALLAAELQRTTLIPYQLEWRFGFKEPFYIENEGKKYFFKGIIDRIDTDNEGHFAIYDYKETAYMSRQDIIEARELQLPVYIMAAGKLLGEVIGTSYIEIKNGKPKHFFYQQDYRQQLGLGRATTKGFNNEEWELWLEQVKAQISQYIDKIKQGQFPPVPYSCTYCHLQAICLYKPSRSRKKLWEGAGA